MSAFELVEGERCTGVGLEGDRIEGIGGVDDGLSALSKSIDWLLLCEV